MQHVPSAKERRYDRQLRLWAASGQAALEDAHVLLINSCASAGVAGIETLKNLILPGIGEFTIQDHALVSLADLGVNFFLQGSSLGKWRAAETCKHLLELNPDVKGHHINTPIDIWLAEEGALDPYTLIIVSAPVHSEMLKVIAEHAWEQETPMIYLHSLGFYSLFSVQLPAAFPIVDTHSDPASMTDLRLLHPWPALTDFARQKTERLNSLSGFDLGHIPYVLLLLHFLDEWKVTHGGEPPLSYQDKTAFRDHVRKAGPPEEENFVEAANAVLKTINPFRLSSSVEEVFSAPELESLTASSESFWYIASAIRTFYQRHQQLPLPGGLPDMKAQSADYMALQNIYKSKAREDCAEVTATIRALEADHGCPEPTAAQDIEQFCKLAAHVKLVRGSDGVMELLWNPGGWPPWSAKALVEALPNPDFDLTTAALVYIAFLAYNLRVMETAHELMEGSPIDEAHIPGELDGAASEVDLDDLGNEAVANLSFVIEASGIEIEAARRDALNDEILDICKEMVRAGGAELHNIASITGGMVAQEIIKIITKQYVPADNTVVFDGIRSLTTVLRLRTSEKGYGLP